MLCATRQSDGQFVLASNESAANAPFSCPHCNDPVLLRIGNSRPSHFAHVNPLACLYAVNESDTHHSCKLEIFEALQREPGVQNVVMERPLGTVRPDVSAFIRNVPVAIEIQISSLSKDEIVRRTREYFRKGIHVLWLLLWTPELDEPKYSPSNWERWIHAAYFGQVFYWTHGLSVTSYRFEPSLKTVPQRSWYSADGQKYTAGGYSRRSIRHRVAIRGRRLRLTSDFLPLRRQMWEGGDIMVPDALLFSAPTNR